MPRRINDNLWVQEVDIQEELDLIGAKYPSIWRRCLCSSGMTGVLAEESATSGKGRRLEFVNRSKAVEMWGHLKVANLLEHGQLIEPAVFLFLRLDVLPNDRLVSANR